MYISVHNCTAYSQFYLQLHHCLRPVSFFRRLKMVCLEMVNRPMLNSREIEAGQRWNYLLWTCSLWILLASKFYMTVHVLLWKICLFSCKSSESCTYVTLLDRAVSSLASESRVIDPQGNYFLLKPPKFLRRDMLKANWSSSSNEKCNCTYRPRKFRIYLEFPSFHQENSRHFFDLIIDKTITKSWTESLNKIMTKVTAWQAFN